MGVRWIPGHRENIEDRRFDPVPEHDVADSVDGQKMLIDVDDLDAWQLIRGVFIELYESSGHYPTARELQAGIRHPGS